MPKPNPLLYLLVFLASWVFATLLVPSLRRIAFKLNVIDRPDQAHKTHQHPVPYLGGFSIVIPVFVLSFIGGLYLIDTETYTRLYIVLFPSLLLSIIGFMDDYLNLTAKTRFTVQLVISITVSIVLIQTGFGSSITEYPVLNFLISVFWIVGLTNAFNFIDNLDGGAGGISFIVGVSLFFLGLMSNQHLIAIFTICIAGASLGFLFWNVSPARIYLGDGGALFIGIVYAIILLQLEPDTNNSFASAVLPVLIMAVPIIDTTVVVVSRILRGVSIFQGGRDHLAHRLQKIGLSRKKTALIIWSISLIFSFFGILINHLEGIIETYIVNVGLSMIGVSIIFFLFLPYEK